MSETFNEKVEREAQEHFRIHTGPQYRNEQGHTIVRVPLGYGPFRTWLLARRAKRLAKKFGGVVVQLERLR